MRDGENWHDGDEDGGIEGEKNISLIDMSDVVVVMVGGEEIRRNRKGKKNQKKMMMIMVVGCAVGFKNCS